jgi:signal transduction histidine kinase
MRTTAARLSALYLILFAITAATLIFYTTSLSLRVLTDQTRLSVAEEVQSLSRVYRAGGLTALVRSVDGRARQPGAFLYLIADPNGRILSGNVQELEPGVLDGTGWTAAAFWYRRYGDASEGRRHQALAEVIRLPNQLILLVGRDLGEPERFRAIMGRALFLALGVMFAGGFLIWFFVGRRALRRIDHITEASRRIVAGDPAGRLPVSGAGDEFDRLSENLNGMLERIARLNEGLRQVSDNIAHDLKTPLTRLRNRAEAALSGRRKTAEYREALEGTIAEADQLIRTFNAILMISRLEAGASPDAAGDVDLNAIVADVVELYEPLAEEQKVTLTIREAAPATVRGNRELIGQALSNIVDNAIKYSAGAVAAPEAVVAIDREGGQVMLSVTDNGPGIRPEDRERATERFVRLEESRSRPGSGLGLALAKAVMRFHRGRLELSGNGAGLKVTMAFPEPEASS